MINLIKAVITANKLKDTKLNTKCHGSFWSWNPQNDKDYLKYAQAVDTIGQYKKLKSIVSNCNIV